MIDLEFVVIFFQSLFAYEIIGLLLSSFIMLPELKVDEISWKQVTISKWVQG